MLGSKIAPDADKAKTRLSARRDRYAARQFLWQESHLRRLKACGRRSTGDGVAIKASGSVADGTRRAGFGGLQSCGSVWSCPVCSEKIQSHRQAELTTGLERWLTPNPALDAFKGGPNSVTFGTLTMRHNASQSLHDLWEVLSPAWNRTLSGSSAWTGTPERVSKKTGRVTPARMGERDLFGVEGYVRVVEVTHGANGWHVHVHFLLFHRFTLDDVQLRALEDSLWGRWSRALKRRGLDASRKHGIDVRRVTDAGDALASYFTKSVYSGAKTAKAAAFEVTGSHAKQAGNGNRTPFELLRAVYEDGDADALAAWHEWEKGSKGRRQFVWSRGLRDVLELDQEQTDEEIAEADELAGDVLEYIDTDEWKASGLSYRLAELLEAAEADDTGHALAVLLNRARARWDADTWPDTA